MDDSYLKYRLNEFLEFNIGSGEYVTIVGNNNDYIIRTLLYINKKGNIFIGDAELNLKNINIIRRRVSFVINKYLNIFVGETVKDEIAFGLESLAIKKNDISQLIVRESEMFKINDLLEKDPNSLGNSDKIKLKILCSIIIKPKILVIDNILSSLDPQDLDIIIDILNEYTKFGGIVINFTNNIEESLYGKRIIIINDRKNVCDGKTLSVLNEEKLLKRLGIGLPFIIELNKYLIDYGIIDKYYLNNTSLVNAIWK